MKKIDFVANRWKYVLLPVVIVIVGAVFMAINGGFNYDVEFLGGTRMQMELGTGYDNDEVASYIEEQTGIKVTIQKTAVESQAIIKTPPIDDAQKNSIVDALKAKFSVDDSAVMSVSTASASFGQEVQRKTLYYALIAVLCILLYIAFRFEWISAIMAIITLAINVAVMYSVYAITNIPMNTTFVAAMLTVIGYSINNTIVVFDRVRENMKKFGGKKGSSIAGIVNTSISESMGRTINSTITTLITIVLLYIIGVNAIKEFALPLIIGIIIGAYTSIFVAAPFWAAWKQSKKDAKAQNAKR